MYLIDTHCHLTEPRLASMLEPLLERASMAGVKKVISVGTTAQTSRECLDIADRYPMVHAAIGIHPTYCHEQTDDDWARIQTWVDHPRVVALGETGLDLYWKECPLETQQKFFANHWELSRRTQLPLIIHMRECTQEMLEALARERERGPLRGVLHSFSESLEVAERLIDLGLYISFAGMVTYKKSQDLREVAAQLPADRILVETDAPYLSPEPYRSQRPNEPQLVVHTADCVAKARGISRTELATLTTRNAHQLFPKLGTIDHP